MSMGNTTDKILYYVADELISAPYLCLECDCLFGVFKKEEEIGWGCKKGYDLHPQEPKPCEED